MGKSTKKIRTNDTMRLTPVSSSSDHGMRLQFPDITVAQCEYTEGPCGLTCILAKDFDRGMRVYKEIRGGWPGDIDCISRNTKHVVSGINIAGGSLLGLESTTGLTAEAMKGFDYDHWPGINGAIIYSGNLSQNRIYPDKALGRFAFNQIDKTLYSGQVGAGLSASHGQGWGYGVFGGIKVLVLVVNNAMGIVYKNGRHTISHSMMRAASWTG